MILGKLLIYSQIIDTARRQGSRNLDEVCWAEIITGHFSLPHSAMREYMALAVHALRN